MPESDDRVHEHIAQERLRALDDLHHVAGVAMGDGLRVRPPCDEPRTSDRHRKTRQAILPRSHEPDGDPTRPHPVPPRLLVGEDEVAFHRAAAALPGRNRHTAIFNYLVRN